MFVIQWLSLSYWVWEKEIHRDTINLKGKIQIRIAIRKGKIVNKRISKGKGVKKLIQRLNPDRLTYTVYKEAVLLKI